jgi:ligand-binding SRPBCC domain-containing protein
VAIRRPRAEVFAFHADAANLARVIPFGVLRPRGDGALGPGRVVTLQFRLGPVAFGGRILVRDWQPPHSFVDVQGFGPFARWEHSHHFFEDGGGTLLRDTVHFALGRPFTALEPIVERAVSAFLALKLRRTAVLLERGPNAVSPAA